MLSSILHLPENVSHLVDQTFVFQILILDDSQLLEKLSLFTGQ
jgi:hypothetical protein